MTASSRDEAFAFLFILAETQMQGVESSVDFGVVRMKEVLNDANSS
jgi:hypothetical protein